MLGLAGLDDPNAISGASEGNFYWVDGSQFWQDGQGGSTVNDSYVNWGFSDVEPDDFQSSQDNLAMALTHWPISVAAGSGLGIASEWNDVNGGNTLAYVIEHNIPEPGSLALSVGGLMLICRLRRARNVRRV